MMRRESNFQLFCYNIQMPSFQQKLRDTKTNKVSMAQSNRKVKLAKAICMEAQIIDLLNEKIKNYCLKYT